VKVRIKSRLRGGTKQYFCESDKRQEVLIMLTVVVDNM